MFGKCLAISDMSWECLSHMNPGFSEVSSFSLELLAVFVWEIEIHPRCIVCWTNTLACGERHGFTRIPKHPMINKLQGCFFASGDLQASRVSKHICCSSWCRMFHPTPFSLQQSFRSRSRVFGSRQVAAPITFKTQKPGCGNGFGEPANLWIREIRTAPKILAERGWNSTLFRGKTRIFN